MEQVNNVFQRVEKKYLLNEFQYTSLLDEMLPYMTADEYGLHTICNIYYDTDYYELISKSLEKPVYKEKFRIRSYGIPTKDSTVFLEIKKKYKGVVFKRRTSLILGEAKAYLEQGVKPQKRSQIMKEIEYFLEKYQPQPKLYLAYDRIAYFGSQNPEIRMTFDTKIRSREDDLSLELGDHGEFLLPDDMHLLEIKVNSAMPIWLANVLSKLQIYPISFSKYGNVYKNKHTTRQLLINGELYRRGDEGCLQVLLKQGR